MSRACNVPGCEKPCRSKGYCNPHYLKWRKYGDPLIDNRPVRQPCTIGGCDELAKARGLCEKHYKRWQVHGDPNVVIELTREQRSRIVMRTRPSFVDRYWGLVQVGDDNECWPWLGQTAGRGYGVLSTSVDGHKRQVYAHRLAILFDCRELTDDQFALHHCDNPPCVNPRHLYAGSHLDNMRDMHDRRRHPCDWQTHCKHGHEFTPENTRISARQRNCRVCERERSQRRRSVA